MKHPVHPLFLLPLIAPLAASATGGAAEVTFREPMSAVEVHDFAEVTMSVGSLQVANPFTEVTVTGEFQSRFNLQLGE